ncbi:MAG: NAD(P)/FAD-dependent oxidoreductase, partial [Nitrospinota bacterium]
MKDRIQYDIALVGAGPANLALALRLVTTSTVPLRLAVLEKSKNIGSHLLSGAVSNPRTLAKLFPDWSTQEDFPLQGIVKDSYLTVLGSNENEDVPRFAIPPYFKKEGYAVLNISDLAHYMAEEIKKIAAEKDNIIVDFYPGFPAQEILFDGNKVIGIKVDNSSDERANNLYANVTVFGEKGFVSRDLIERFNLRKSAQTWAVGVKEVWEVPRDYEGKVWHTVGYPLVAGELGGGFIYGLKNNKIILGLITGLDSPNPNIRPVTKLQTLKKHPWVQELIKDGKLLQYGASVLPEGGYYALPEKFAVSGAMLVGDALGTLDVKRFSGVDKAMESGIIAADILSLASANNEFSESF